jgi:hypothetical protein
MDCVTGLPWLNAFNGIWVVVVIPLLEDTLKEWGFLQVMTQVIGQELYQAALHPLPVGSKIMGGQGKE